MHRTQEWYFEEDDWKDTQTNKRLDAKHKQLLVIQVTALTSKS